VLYLPTVFLSAAAAMAGAIVLRGKRLFALVMVVGIVAAGLATTVVNDRWVVAARLAHDVSRAAARHDPSQSLFLNVPDNYRGAYVLRNGLHQAATVFLDRTVEGEYRPLVTHDVGSLSDEILVFAQRDGYRLQWPAGRHSRIILLHGLPVTITRYSSGVLISIDDPAGLAGVELLSYRGYGSDPEAIFRPVDPDGP
jgi:hypothetical protein